jgi:hypothetical protein
VPCAGVVLDVMYGLCGSEGNALYANGQTCGTEDWCEREVSDLTMQEPMSTCARRRDPHSQLSINKTRGLGVILRSCPLTPSVWALQELLGGHLYVSEV